MSLVAEDYQVKLANIFNKSLERALPQKSEVTTPSVWAEQNRVMANDLSANPGRWDNDNAPYLREIMDNFSPHSNCREFVVLKATRMGFTTAIINVFGWIIDQRPCATRLLIPLEETLKDVMNLQLVNMIKTSGLEQKIIATNNLKTKKSTGNSTFKKDFLNGHIIGTSLNSKAALASYAAQVIVVDEFDEILKGKEKSGDDIRTRVRDRASTYGRRARLAYMSMPSDKKTSQVYKLFLDGDQRYYFVPCPHCGYYQRLQWQDEEGNFWFHYDVDGQNHYIKGSSALICQNEPCGKKITENYKYDMLVKGEWRATARAKDGELRSYQINALYSNFRDWDDIAQQWVEAQGDVERLQTFVKSILGEPWEDRESSNLWRFLAAINRGDTAASRHVFRWSPEQLASIKYITMGVDVQHDRLELQVVGWASYHVAYDLHYIAIEPSGLDLELEEKGANNLSLAFSELRQMIETNNWQSPYLGNGELTLYMKKVVKLRNNSNIIAPHVIFIDAGFKSDKVYNLIASLKDNRRVFPSRGQNNLPNGLVVDAKKNLQAGNTVVHMNTDILKLELDSAIRGSNFNDVAINIQHHRDEKYFKMLASEHRVERNGKYYWEKNAGKHGRNEVLDCWVMARGALWHLAQIIFSKKSVEWDRMFK